MDAQGYESTDIDKREPAAIEVAAGKVPLDLIDEIEVNHEYHDEDEEQPLGAWVIVKCWVPEMAIQEYIANQAVTGSACVLAVVAPCQKCGEPVPENEALGDPDGEWLCPDCYPQTTEGATK